MKKVLSVFIVIAIVMSFCTAAFAIEKMPIDAVSVTVGEFKSRAEDLEIETADPTVYMGSFFGEYVFVCGRSKK